MKELIYFISLSFIMAFAITSCKDKPINAFDRYPHSDFYRYDDEVCVDSFIDSVGNPHFIFRNGSGTIYDCELDDTLVVIDGYLIPGYVYTPEQIKKIRNI